MRKHLLLILSLALLAGCAARPNLENTEGAQTGLPTWSAGSKFTSSHGNTIDDFLEDHETRLDTIEALTGPVFSDGDGTYTDMSSISSAELGYLNGVTSAIQTQIDASNSVANNNDTRLDTLEAVNGIIEGIGDGTYTAIDTSAEVYAAISDETGAASGSPLLMFNQNPTINGMTVSGTVTDSSATWPTWNQNTTGTAAGITGDLDPDQLTGDSTDNNLIDGDLLSPPSTVGIVVSDSGDGNPATGTVTPTASVMMQSYTVDCQDADTCTMTMSEATASDRMVIRVFSYEASVGSCTFATSVGVQTVRATRTLEAGESIVFEYRSNYWNEVAESTGAYSGFDGSDVTIGGCSGTVDTVACSATEVLLDQNTDMGTGTLDLSGKTITFPSGGWYFTDEDSSPTLVGQFKYDNTVAGLTDGALEHHNGTEVRYVVDIATLPTITGQSPVYNSSSGKWVPGQRGAVTHATKATAYTVGTDSPEECYGGVIYVTSAATITACDGLDANMSFTVVTIGAIAVSVDTQADDLMLLDAVALDDGDKATNTSTAGDTIHCSYYSAAGWYCWSGSPDGDHWTDGGP